MIWKERRLPMKVWLALSLTWLALPHVGNAAEPPAHTAPAPPPAPAPSATADKLTDTMRVVTIDPNARPPVCRRVVPTGSRIAEQRCETPKRGSTAADEANRTVLRRDIEALRDQQLMREQARQAAMAEALRRRGQ
jgi:hypothetical protein